MKMSVLNKRYRDLYEELPDDYNSQLDYIKSHNKIDQSKVDK